MACRFSGVGAGTPKPGVPGGFAKHKAAAPSVRLGGAHVKAERADKPRKGSAGRKVLPRCYWGSVAELAHQACCSDVLGAHAMQDGVRLKVEGGKQLRAPAAPAQQAAQPVKEEAGAQPKVGATASCSLMAVLVLQQLQLQSKQDPSQECLLMAWSFPCTDRAWGHACGAASGCCAQRGSAADRAWAAAGGLPAAGHAPSPARPRCSPSPGPLQTWLCARRAWQAQAACMAVTGH